VAVVSIDLTFFGLVPSVGPTRYSSVPTSGRDQTRACGQSAELLWRQRVRQIFTTTVMNLMTNADGVRQSRQGLELSKITDDGIGP
jgi:hypothetical protein